MDAPSIRPQEGGQSEFLSWVRVNEILFGGAAGPGKSWSLVIDALGLQYEMIIGKAAIEVPDYRAVLFRRKTTQFTKLIDEGKKYYPFYGAEFVYTRPGDPGPSFNFPSGAKIFICHMNEEDNKEDHQGQEYQYCGFDELTQFTITQYTYLFSRLRNASIPGLNARMRATTNPTGSGLIWVKKRFINTGSQVFEPNKLYWFVPDPKLSIEDNPTGIVSEADNEFAKSRMFIPGKLAENKILQENDPDYKLNIMLMGKKYEEALLDGNWDAFGGDFFDDFDRKKHVVTPFEIPHAWKIAAAVDPGWSNACAFGLFAIDLNNNVYVLFTTSQKGNSPTQNARYVKERIKGFKYTRGEMPKYIVSGADAFAKKDRNAIIANDATFADKWLEEDMFLEKATTDRINGWMTVKEYMRFDKVFFFEGYCESLIEEITAAPTDEKDPDDIQGKGNDPTISDHNIDMFRYFLNSKDMPRKFTDIDDMPAFWKDKIAREKKKKKEVFANNYTSMSY